MARLEGLEPPTHGLEDRTRTRPRPNPMIVRTLGLAVLGAGWGRLALVPGQNPDGAAELGPVAPAERRYGDPGPPTVASLPWRSAWHRIRGARRSPNPWIHMVEPRGDRALAPWLLLPPVV